MGVWGLLASFCPFPAPSQTPRFVQEAFPLPRQRGVVAWGYYSAVIKTGHFLENTPNFPAGRCLCARVSHGLGCSSSSRAMPE